MNLDYTPFSVLSLLILLHSCHSELQRPIPIDSTNITPIPMENLNPRLVEFKRIDSNNDNQISFAEFLMEDRQYIEDRSRNFHQFDKNADGLVSLKEFESYPRGNEYEEHGRPNYADNFFRQLGTNIYPAEAHYNYQHNPFFKFRQSIPKPPTIPKIQASSISQNEQASAANQK